MHISKTGPAMAGPVGLDATPLHSMVEFVHQVFRESVTDYASTKRKASIGKKSLIAGSVTKDDDTYSLH